MKKIQQQSFRFINKLISLLLTLLGVSCSGQNISDPTHSTDNPPTIAMYGVPYSTYQVSGIVENAQSEPVQGIEVKMVNADSGTITAANGTFILEGRNRFRRDTLQIAVHDVDEAENGHYQNDTIDIAVTYKTDESSKSWSMGDAKEVIKIVVKEKK